MKKLLVNLVLEVEDDQLNGCTIEEWVDVAITQHFDSELVSMNYGELVIEGWDVTTLQQLYIVSYFGQECPDMEPDMLVMVAERMNKIGTIDDLREILEPCQVEWLAKYSREGWLGDDEAIDNPFESFVPYKWADIVWNQYMNGGEWEVFNHQGDHTEYVRFTDISDACEYVDNMKF